VKKRISILVLSNSGAPARQFSTSKTFLRGTALLFVLLLCAGSYVGYDYYRLKLRAVRLQQHEAELGGLLTSQRNELDFHRHQISDFANEINTLKDKLVALNQFEKKIRLMTDIEKRPDSGGLFGVGGPPPRAMDPKLALSEESSSLMREMHSQIEQIGIAAENQADGFSSLAGQLDKQKRLLASTPTIRPIDPDVEHLVTSRFDYRISPFTGAREFHKGFDISARDGTPIYATAGGTVTFSGSRDLLGQTVIIDHGHGLSTVYGHCSKLLKKQGEKVGRWDTIALVGTTGRSTGPHVHYEVHLHGVPVNPEKYFLN
jgi:murein DD-endopeptidase MepM/ murein hydrolase activator NlpD